MTSGYGFDESTKAAFTAMASHVNALVEGKIPTDTTPITKRLDDLIKLLAQNSGANPVGGGTCGTATSTILSTLNNLSIASPSPETLDIRQILTKWCEDSANKGFPDARLPAITPLLVKGDYSGDAEGELRDLAVQMFRISLSSRAFDASVIGAAQLGSTDLVRFALAKDGLALANSDIGHQSMRYLYKAWMSRNKQGRGLHFLRTYLQLQFGSSAEVYQLWQKNNLPYPSDLLRKRVDNAFLTSRLSIEILDDALREKDAGMTMGTIASVLPSVLPARLIPKMVAKASAGTSELNVLVRVITTCREMPIPHYPLHIAKFVASNTSAAVIVSKPRLKQSRGGIFPEFRDGCASASSRNLTSHTRLKEAA